MKLRELMVYDDKNPSFYLFILHVCETLFIFDRLEMNIIRKKIIRRIKIKDEEKSFYRV